MLRQFLHILLCLDVIGMEVYDLCLDGGGSNRGFVSKILNNTKFFTNPFSSTKCSSLFVWYCMTHMQKNMRNQLLTSDGKEKAARQFLTYMIIHLAGNQSKNSGEEMKKESQTTCFQIQTLLWDLYILMSGIRCQ